MIAYRTTTRIDQNGNVFLRNLPFKNQKSVEIILLVEDGKEKSLSTKSKLETLKSSFGTLTTETILSGDDLRRVNIYSSDGR